MSEWEPCEHPSVSGVTDICACVHTESRCANAHICDASSSCIQAQSFKTSRVLSPVKAAQNIKTISPCVCEDEVEDFDEIIGTGASQYFDTE